MSRAGERTRELQSSCIFGNASLRGVPRLPGSGLIAEARKLERGQRGGINGKGEKCINSGTGSTILYLPGPCGGGFWWGFEPLPLVNSRGSAGLGKARGIGTQARTAAPSEGLHLESFEG